MRVRATCHGCGEFLDPAAIAEHRQRCGARAVFSLMATITDRFGTRVCDVTPGVRAAAYPTVIPLSTTTVITHPDGRVERTISE